MMKLLACILISSFAIGCSSNQMSKRKMSSTENETANIHLESERALTVYSRNRLSKTYYLLKNGKSLYFECTQKNWQGVKGGYLSIYLSEDKYVLNGGTNRIYKKFDSYQQCQRKQVQAIDKLENEGIFIINGEISLN